MMEAEKRKKVGPLTPTSGALPLSTYLSLSLSLSLSLTPLQLSSSPAPPAKALMLSSFLFSLVIFKEPPACQKNQNPPCKKGKTAAKEKKLSTLSHPQPPPPPAPPSSFGANNQSPHGFSLSLSISSSFPRKKKTRQKRKSKSSSKKKKLSLPPATPYSLSPTHSSPSPTLFWLLFPLSLFFSFALPCFFFALKKTFACSTCFDTFYYDASRMVSF